MYEDTATSEAAAPELRDRNPHLMPRSSTNYPCPYGRCGGEGFVLDEETNVATPCECRTQRIAHARHRSLRSKIPERYRDVAWDRNPVPELIASLDPSHAAQFKRFGRTIADRLDKGEGLWFMGPRGTGKTTLAMLLSIEAMRQRRAVGVYTAPQLLDDIYANYRREGAGREDLLERLVSVDLLHLDDLAAVAPNDHVLQTFYSVVNERYQRKRSIIFTADVQAPPLLSKYVGERVYSRLFEMCGDPILMFGDDYRLRAHGETA